MLLLRVQLSSDKRRAHEGGPRNGDKAHLWVTGLRSKLTFGSGQHVEILRDLPGHWELDWVGRISEKLRCEAAVFSAYSIYKVVYTYTANMSLWVSYKQHQTKRDDQFAGRMSTVLACS